MSLDLETVSRLVGSLALMKFFPAGDDCARAALIEMLGEMCETEDQVRWLVKRVRSLYSEWPGDCELRACYCSRFTPLDGIRVNSAVFLDGIPSERAAEPWKRLESSCNECGGYGYTIIERAGISAAEPCSKCGPKRIAPAAPAAPEPVSVDAELDRAVKQIAAQKTLDSRK